MWAPRPTGGGCACRRTARLSLTLDLGLPGWKEYGAVEKGLTIAFAASIVVAGGTLAYVVLTPRPGETFTEFYILGLASHESVSVNFTVRVDLVGVQIVYNATARANETVEMNRTTWSWFNVTLANGANWTHPYTFSIPAVGLWKVQFLLYKDGDSSSVYRELHLYVTVT